jgi:hypothetical protein
MTFTTHQNQIRTIKQDDPRFHIVDNFIQAPRAGFEINQHIPYEYKLILTECLDRGWIKPVAYMTERELLISGLSNENSI